MDKDKEITFRRYLILRILKENIGNYTVYWLRNQMSKEGLSIHEKQVRRIVANMILEGLLIFTKGKKKNSKFIYITEKGIKEFNRLHLKMRLLLNKVYS